MPTLHTNIGTYKLATTDARDIRPAYRVLLDEMERAHRVCVEAIAAFSGLVTGVVDHTDRLRGEFEEWMESKAATRAAYAEAMERAARTSSPPPTPSSA